MERKDYHNIDEEKHNFYKIDCSLFVISFLVVLSKAVIGYSSTLPYFSNFWDNVLFHPFSSILAVLFAVWVSLEWLLRPVLTGMMMSFLTWRIMYLDSDIPGVNPPTPFTYHKYYANNRLRRNHQYHLCYLFAMAVAPLTTLSILINDYFIK